MSLRGPFTNVWPLTLTVDVNHEGRLLMYGIQPSLLISLRGPFTNEWPPTLTVDVSYEGRLLMYAYAIRTNI